ncbi:MAG: hypothetical protein P1U74_09335 [Legionellaceae bacterium]|nr:hypothetical protein [Legionellaceae bacterium]
MLVETFLEHPLLSKLYDIDNQIINILNIDKLKNNGDFYKIGVRELRAIFNELCENNDESYHVFLSFDYHELSQLEDTNPFYLETSDVIGQEQLIKQLLKANKTQCESLAFAMLDKLQDWVDTNTNNSKDLFDDETIKTLKAISVYMPDRVHALLSEVLTSDFALTFPIFENINYNAVLKLLTKLALSNKYFEFSVNTFLLLAVKEGKMGVYHRAYKAPGYLSNLLVLPTSQLNVSFQERCDILDQKIRDADAPRSYYKLHTLMLALGHIATNLVDIDDYTFEKEAYVRFAVHKLLHYTGRDDDDGLCITAEEQIHIILEQYSDSFMTDIAFIILRYQHENKREWNQSITSDLERIYLSIKDTKDDGREKASRIISQRLEQLESIDGEREFFAEDFTLYFGAKKTEKRCIVNVSKEDEEGLSLHERQSLAERLIYSQTTNIHKIDRSWPKTTYIIANFGIVISDRPQIKGGEQKRVFISVPISIDYLTITGRDSFEDGHAEEALYSFLLNFSNVTMLLEQIRLKLMLPTLAEHKVYAFILDLHGTYDMCQSCSVKGLEFQNAFRTQISNQFPSMNIKLPLKFKSQLPVVIRYSSDIKYHYNNSTVLKKIGLRTLLQDKSSKEIETTEVDEDIERSARDIRHFSKNMLVHGKSNWHSFWDKKRVETKTTNAPIKLESWTAFTTDKSMRFMSSQQQRAPYTTDGEVDINQPKVR